MKYLSIALLLAFISTYSFATNNKCTTPQTVATVNGMVCDICAQSIKKTFLKSSEVAEVQIDLTAKTVTIDMKAGENLSDAKVKELIDYSGYELVKIDHSCKKV